MGGHGYAFDFHLQTRTQFKFKKLFVSDNSALKHPETFLGMAMKRTQEAIIIVVVVISLFQTSRTCLVMINKP